MLLPVENEMVVGGERKWQWGCGGFGSAGDKEMGSGMFLLGDEIVLSGALLGTGEWQCVWLFRLGKMNGCGAIGWEKGNERERKGGVAGRKMAVCVRGCFRFCLAVVILGSTSIDLPLAD